ncbi:formylmethanofuran dehydrogenase subunit C, partial [bacterium]|nr:formylmethanofuran dehydrogenase subunit C [bacterium]
MPLVLEPLAATGALAIDLAGIVPDRIATLSQPALCRLEVRADERPAELGSLFRIAGDASDGRIECRGDCSRVHFLGARMAWGEILVAGDLGRHAGEGMTGGTLTVHGDAGDWLGCEIAGGSVHVAGRAG